MSLLSIGLAVRNEQARLESLVHETLDVVHDLVPRVELVILDNASGDATPEVAHELAMRYPQVRVVTFPLPVDRGLLWRAALAESHGETLLVRDPECQLDIHALPKLWQELPGRDAVLATAAPHRARGWVGVIQRLGQHVSHLEQGPSRHDLVLIRRRAFDAGRAAIARRGPLGVELTRYGHPWVELTLRSRSLGSIPPVPAAPSRQPGQAASTSRPDQAPGQPRRPNYLAGLKNFALGE